MTNPTFDNISFRLSRRIDICPEIESWRKSGDLRNLEKIQIWSYFFIKRFYSDKFINGKIKRSSDVESLIETAYLKFYHNHEKVKSPELFSRWLNVLCSHELAEFYKVKKHTSESLVENPDNLEAGFAEDIRHDFEHDEERNELFRNIRQVVSKAEAEVIFKKIIENKTNSEISSELAIQEQSVKNHYSRGIEKIRNSLIIRNMLKNKINNFY